MANLSYTIKAGDTLSRIARTYNTTVDELMRLNPQIKNPNLINAGASLTLASAPSAASEVAAKIAAPAASAANTLTYMNVPTLKADSEYQTLAGQTVSKNYESQRESAKQQADLQQLSLSRVIEALAPALEKQLESLASGYEKERQVSSDAALTRGMGRSSYLLDQLANSAGRQNSDEQSARSDAENRQLTLQREIDLVAQHLAATLSAMDTDKESALMSEIARLRSSDESNIFSAQKYNNDLLLKEQELALKREKEEAAQQLALDKLSQQQAQFDAKNSGSSKSSSSSSSSSKSSKSNSSKTTTAKADLTGGAVYTQEELQRYNGELGSMLAMTPAERADYLNRNRSRLQNTLGPLFYKLLKAF